eukprot:Gb_37697 [translate_table: standard]
MINSPGFKGMVGASELVASTRVLHVGYHLGSSPLCFGTEIWLRFLTSTPLKKYSQHVNCHSKYQAILRWNRSLSPLHANSSHNAFYSSSSWSKGIFTSYFGQNFVSVKNFDHLSRHGRAKAGQRVNVLVKWTKSLLFNLIKVIGTLCLIISLVIIAAPSFLSSSVGLHSAVWLTNKVIPGKASIKSISIGWTTPVSIEEVLLEGTDGKTVLVIPKIETKASLWSFIAGRAGFGEWKLELFLPLLS